MNLTNLRAFIVFAEHLNFTHAAESLHVTQPALHAKVKSLAKELGVELYVRVGRQLKLTEDGERVLAFGRELTEQCETFYGELHGVGRKEPVVLAAGEGAYLYLLGEGISRFLAQKSAPLRLLTRNSMDTVKAVRTGEAHLGVAVLRSLPKGVDVTPLASFDYRLVLPRKDPLAKRRTIALQDLADLGLVVPAVNSPFRTFLENALHSVGVNLQVAVETRGWHLTLHFVKQGLGAAVVNGCCHLPKGLVAKKLSALGKVDYYILRRAGVKARGPVATLYENLVDGP